MQFFHCAPALSPCMPSLPFPAYCDWGVFPGTALVATVFSHPFRWMLGVFVAPFPTIVSGLTGKTGGGLNSQYDCGGGLLGERASLGQSQGGGWISNSHGWRATIRFLIRRLGGAGREVAPWAQLSAPPPPPKNWPAKSALC